MPGPSYYRAMVVKNLKAQGLNQKQIAAILGCTRANVTYLSRKYGLGDWPIGRPAIPDGWNNQRLIATTVVVIAGRDLTYCERCQQQFKEELHIHHVDEDRRNNDISNLKVLCNSCHHIEHIVKRKRDSKGRLLNVTG